MSKLSVQLPRDLENILDRYIPWGSKGAVVTEVMWQIAEQAQKDGGKSIYNLIQASVERNKTVVSN